MGRLTTHVLDTASGRPAEGLRIDLFDAAGEFLLSALTNSDGRCDRPLLEGDELSQGIYELRFHAGDYLRATGQTEDDPLFLDVIPIRFGVNDADAYYHVPLLLSPFGYSTYRGS